MNPLNLSHIKTENPNSIKIKYQKLIKVTNFFRVFEIFLVIAVISRIFFQLPLALALEICSEYFQAFSLILDSPPFAFVLGNAIVITLVVNSRHLKTPCNVKPPKKSTTIQPKKQKQPPRCIPYTRKQEKIQCTQTLEAQRKDEKTTKLNSNLNYQLQMGKLYHRSNSERFRREQMVKGCCVLRRSNTEIKSLKSCGCCKINAGKGHYPEDHMSKEEFQKTVEDFIAKQQMLQREEEELFDHEADFGL